MSIEYTIFVCHYDCHSGTPFIVILSALLLDRLWGWGRVKFISSNLYLEEDINLTLPGIKIQ